MLACLTSITRADLPSIRFDRLTPLGAAAGTTVEVEVTGADVEGVDALLFDHPGLTAQPIAGSAKTGDGDRGPGMGRKRGRRRASSRFRVTVAANVPPGTYDVRLVGRWGVSNPRLFAVSHGLTDIAEKEPNNDAAQAQEIAVNSAVNGMFDGNGEDLFRFTAAKGQRVVIDCQAGKLDSPLDPTLTLATADGRPLAASGDYNGRDPLIDFIAPADGDYLITVYDLSYRGGSPYRLIVSDHPYVENVWPRAVRAGESAELTALGRNLGQGAVRSALSIGDLPLEERRIRITPPADVLGLGAYRFLEHPTDHSVLPTAATCTLTGFQVRLFAETASPSLTAHSLLVCDSPVTLEVEPNDDPAKPQSVSLPLVLSGRFDRPRDADWFELAVAEAGNYAFDVYCERINGRADPYLVVTDDQGNRVTELDDYGHRINAFDGHLRDPSGMVSLAAKRKYRVLVQDRYGRGGARYQYVLTIRKPRPDFHAAVIHSQNPGPGGTTIWRGGAVYLDVILHQREGYSGDITLTAEKLPPGVHATPTVIPNNQRGQMILWADADAADFTGPIRLLASGRRGPADAKDGSQGGQPAKEELFTREVRPYTRVWNDASLNSSRPTRELVVAVRDGAPFGLRFEPDRVEVEAGKPVQFKLKLDRHWADFRSDVNVLPLEFPGNFRLGTSKIAAGQNELTVTIDVQGGTRPGDITLAVMGQAQVPFSKDPEAKDRPPTLVSLPSQPVTITVKKPAK